MGDRAMAPSASSAPVVRLTGVTKIYRAGDTIVRALHGVSLDVHTGELGALTGPSGSGKSTLLNLCGPIDTPDSRMREIAGVAVNGCAQALRVRW